VRSRALVLLLFVPCAALHAQGPPACEVYTRDSATAPPMVHAWLAASSDVRVSVCRSGDAAEEQVQYQGEGVTRHRGTVCSYVSHGLTPVGAGAARRLQRYEPGEALAMRASSSASCPPARFNGTSTYTLTYEVNADEFLGLTQWWAHAAQPPGELTASGDAAARLRAAIAAGRMHEVGVLRMVRMPGSPLRHRYSLFVPDPEQPSAAVYVLYLSRRARGSWQLTGIALTTP
jgi:hypothetical protein